MLDSVIAPWIKGFLRSIGLIALAALFMASTLIAAFGGVAILAAKFVGPANAAFGFAALLLLTSGVLLIFAARAKRQMREARQRFSAQRLVLQSLLKILGHGSGPQIAVSVAGILVALAAAVLGVTDSDKAE